MIPEPQELRDAYGLTALQAAILSEMAGEQRWYSRTELAACSARCSPGSVKVLVHGLRQKLLAHDLRIHTAWRMGYQLEPETRARLIRGGAHGV